MATKLEKVTWLSVFISFVSGTADKCGVALSSNSMKLLCLDIGSFCVCVCCLHVLLELWVLWVNILENFWFWKYLAIKSIVERLFSSSLVLSVLLLFIQEGNNMAVAVCWWSALDKKHFAMILKSSFNMSVLVWPLYRNKSLCVFGVRNAFSILT